MYMIDSAMCRGFLKSPKYRITPAYSYSTALSHCRGNISHQKHLPDVIALQKTQLFCRKCCVKVLRRETFILAGHSFFSRSKEGEGLTHRRRIKTEATAKVVASVWGTECIQFLAALAILYQDDFGNQDEFILFFKSSWCNSFYFSNLPSAPQLARQGIEYILSPQLQYSDNLELAERCVLLFYRRQTRVTAVPCTNKYLQCTISICYLFLFRFNPSNPPTL